MFSNLRKGSQIYILHKSATPFIEVGTIETISNIPMIGYYPSMPSYPIDVTVKVGEKTTTYQRLPTNAEAVDVTEMQSGEIVTIACTKDAVNTEVQSLRQKSMDAINSVSFHEQRIKACDNLLTQLNPEVAEKQQQAQEISELKNQLSDMKQMMAQLTEQLKSEKTKARKEKEL